MIIFFDAGLLVFLGFMFYLLVGGAAYSLAEWLAGNVPAIIVICVIVSLVIGLIAFFSTKSILLCIASIAFMSQVCFFIPYGLYLISLMMEAYPVRCIMRFFLFAIYGLLNFCGVGMAVMYASEEAYCEDGNKMKGECISFSVLMFIGTAIGWGINWLVL